METNKTTTDSIYNIHLEPTYLREAELPLVLNNFTFKEYNFSKKDVAKIKFFDKECFYLIYCWSGKLSCVINGKRKRIRAQESLILNDAQAEGIIIEPETIETVRFFAIAFAKSSTSFSKDIDAFLKFRKVFSECIPENQNYYIGNINLEIFEKINALTQISHENIAKEFIVEGILFQIYGLKMAQMITEANQATKTLRGFTNWEIEQLKIVSELITQNPGKDYSIEYLCRESGLGPNKLQKGFRKMYNRSVMDYIRNVRLEKSLQLIKNTNMSISEIVYSLGLTSRSYFSKIFRHKYHCSPKHFQKLQRE